MNDYQAGGGRSSEDTINVNKTTRNILLKVFILRVVNLVMTVSPQIKEMFLSVKPKRR